MRDVWRFIQALLMAMREAGEWLAVMLAVVALFKAINKNDDDDNNQQ